LDTDIRTIRQAKRILTPSFKEGFALASKDGKWGFINKNSDVVVPFKYDEARSFSEGFTLVGKDYKYGFIDKIGKM